MVINLWSTNNNPLLLYHLRILLGGVSELPVAAVKSADQWHDSKNGER